MLVVAMREKVVISEGEECSLWRLVERVFRFGHREFSDLGIEFLDLSFQIDGVLSLPLSFQYPMSQIITMALHGYSSLGQRESLRLGARIKDERENGFGVGNGSLADVVS